MDRVLVLRGSKMTRLKLSSAALCIVALAVMVSGCGGDDKKVKRNDSGILVAPFEGQTTKVARRPIAVTTGADAAWVTSMAGGVLTKLDAETAKKDGKPVEIDDAPYQTLYAFDRVWVAAFQNDKLFQVDPETGKVIKFTKTDNRPFGMAAGFGSLWLTSIRNQTLSRIDPATGKRVGDRIKLSGTPYKVTTGFGSVWVTNVDTGVIDRIDPDSGEIIGTVRVGSTCDQVATAKLRDLPRQESEYPIVVTNCAAPAAIIAAGKYIWVSNLRGDPVKSGEATDVQVEQGIPNGQVFRIDPKDNSMVGDPIPVPIRPLAMAGDDNSIWVIGVETDSLLRINAQTAKRDELPIAIGNAPTDVALGSGKVWVTLSKDDRVASMSAAVK